MDLSGTYANCDNIHRRDGFLSVDRVTPEGDSIQALVGSVWGRDSHVDAVVGYIREMVDKWINNYQYREQVTGWWP